VNGVITKFFYDGDDLIIETGNDPNALIARYLFGPGIDEPLERNGSTTHYYSADGLGSTVHLTNASGAIAESYTYDVFGQPTIRNGSGTIIPTTAVGNRFLFTGREWESELGLQYNRARYYSPKTGRFLSRDPLGADDGPNLYTYVRNNSPLWIDPAGTTSVLRLPGLSGVVPWVGPSTNNFIPSPQGQKLQPTTFQLPKSIRIFILLGGIILGPVVGPIEDIVGTGKPIAPKPREKPPAEAPAPGKRGEGGKDDDEEEKDNPPEKSQPRETPGELPPKKGTKHF